MQQALQCPCIADLRASTCGAGFTEAFTCFLRSSHPEKGSDCYPLFDKLRQCMMAHSDEYADFSPSKTAAK